MPVINGINGRDDDRFLTASADDDAHDHDEDRGGGREDPPSHNRSVKIIMWRTLPDVIRLSFLHPEK
jgi:hypothetical protein